MYLYQNNKACEILLLCIFKHDISRKSAVQLLLFFCCKKKQKLQSSGLTSKHSNSFVIVFIVWRQFFCFVLFLWDKFWWFYHFSELSNLKRNVLFMEIYIYKWKGKIKYAIFYVKKRRKKLFFNWLQEVIFPQFFACFECKYVLIALVYGKIKY